MISYDDNRNFFRMMVNTNIEVEISDADAGRKITAICRDLSATGMAIEADEHIEPGTEVKCRVDSTSSDVQPLQASATVVRCTQEDSGVFMLGVEINQQM